MTKEQIIIGTRVALASGISFLTGTIMGGVSHDGNNFVCSIKFDSNKEPTDYYINNFITIKDM